MHKFPSTLAGHTTSGDVFANYIHKSLTDNKQNLVVFLQDKVSVCQTWSMLIIIAIYQSCGSATAYSWVPNKRPYMHNYLIKNATLYAPYLALYYY